MEPVKSVAPAITAFVYQLREMATPELSDKIAKLTESQIALALKIIQNKNNIWGSYQEGTDTKMEKDLVKIVMVLAGATDGNNKPGFSLQSFLQSREKQEEVREKQMTQLVNSINKSSIQITQPHIFEEKTTDELLREMMGTELTSDILVAKQLYRELAGGLIGKVKIEDKNVEMTKPTKCPDDWSQMIPKEIKDYIGSKYRSIAPSIAIFLTQGIAFDPLNKAIEIIRDPVMPEAEFKADFPHFNFIKKNGDILLEVTTKGFLGLLDRDTGHMARLKNYEIIQLINLTNPATLVKMTIAPRDQL
jgi:hypothetical protein